MSKPIKRNSAGRVDEVADGFTSHHAACRPGKDAAYPELACLGRADIPAIGLHDPQTGLRIKRLFEMREIFLQDRRNIGINNRGAGAFILPKFGENFR